MKLIVLTQIASSANFFRSSLKMPNKASAKAPMTLMSQESSMGFIKPALTLTCKWASA